ncbi:Helix-turn-helix domain-containing protein [Paenibacillus sp. 1_12]|uniref:helix-turn-helix domain-containing protein n=1 Tax=Paenibacillus sp. 1_12 TaxID=1566278 RepID=UPI0008EBCA4E|nr:helix-turn-helix domain-containing protein [Paenibacillus sp. 1_12]SFM17658.1 Helix-turn-helix domain-containing protein [Paenibacillus sp. 1_12]
MKFNWRSRLLLSYLPIFFVVVIILITVFFMSMSEFSKQEAKKANEIYVKRILETIDSSLISIDQTITKEVMSNNKYAHFFRNEDSSNKYYSSFEASIELFDLLRYVPLIDSVYLYRSSDQVVLTDKSSSSFDEFGDREFLLRGIENGIPRRYTDLRMYQENIENKQGRPVITIVKKMVPPFGNEGYIVVNIRLDSLKQLVQPMLNSKISHIDVFDKHGSFLFGDSQWVADATVQARPSAITKVTSEYTGWEVDSNFADMQLFGVFSVLSYVWMSIGIFSLLAGGIWIFYITRQNYKPIETIMAHIYQYSQNRSNAFAGKADSDEFKFIEVGIHNLIEQSIRYEKQYEENQAYRSKHFFQELLDGNLTVNPSRWADELLYKGFGEDFESYAVIVVEIDTYTKFISTYNVKDQNLLKFAVSSVLKEICQNHGVTIWSEWIDTHHLAVIFPIAVGMDGDGLIHVVGDETIRWVSANLPFTVTIGIGSITEHLEGVSVCYDDAMEALQYKLTLGNNRLLDHSQIVRQPIHKDMFKSLQSIRSITQSFRLGDENWKEEYAKIFKEIQSRSTPKDELISMMNYMVYQMYRESVELSEELQQVWEQKMPELNAILDHFETLKELDLRFYDVLNRAAEDMRRIREGKTHYQLIGEMKAYIETHFADTDLSLSSLSDRFELHPNYLSRLFKEEFGEKFIDYLTTIRIERAKKLLLETSLSIQDVAAQVGYSLPVSFIRVFKKHVGSTPGDYRKGTLP